MTTKSRLTIAVLLAALLSVIFSGSPASATTYTPSACSWTPTATVHIYKSTSLPPVGWVRVWVNRCGLAKTEVYGNNYINWTAALATPSNADVGSYTHYGTGAFMAAVYVGCVDVRGWGIANDFVSGDLIAYGYTAWHYAC